MSRHILIEGTFFNNKKVFRGVYKPTNAEYFKSNISELEMIKCLKLFKKDLNNKRLKDLKIIHNISSEISSDSFHFIYTSPELTKEEMIRQIRINNAVFISYK